MLFKWRQIDISSDWEDFQFRQLHLRSLLRDSHPERCSSCGCRKVGFPMFQVVGFDVSADPNTSEGTPQSVCHTFPLLICAEVLFWCFARCLTCLTCLISLLWGQSHRHDFLTVQSLRRWDLSQGDNPMVLRLEAWAIAPQLRWVSVSDTAVPAAGCWVGRGVGLYVLGLDCLLACSSFLAVFQRTHSLDLFGVFLFCLVTYSFTYPWFTGVALSTAQDVLCIDGDGAVRIPRYRSGNENWHVRTNTHAHTEHRCLMLRGHKLLRLWCTWDPSRQLPSAVFSSVSNNLCSSFVRSLYVDSFQELAQGSRTSSMCSSTMPCMIQWVVNRQVEQKKQSLESTMHVSSKWLEQDLFRLIFLALREHVATRRHMSLNHFDHVWNNRLQSLMIALALKEQLVTIEPWCTMKCLIRATTSSKDEGNESP